jgi:predicted porin
MNISNLGETTNGAITTNDASFIAAHNRIYGAGVSYAVGPALFGFVYSHSSLDNPTANGYLGNGTFPIGVAVNSLKFDNFEVNAKYNFTPAFFTQVMYTFTLGKFNASNGSSRPQWHEAGLMFDYNLSKRTDLYIQGVYQQVVGGSTGTFLDNAFITGTDGQSSSNKQVVARVAIRHAF